MKEFKAKSQIYRTILYIDNEILFKNEYSLYSAKKKTF